jgi:hypothetical protein
MNKKLKSANKEIKALKKKVSESEAKQSQARVPSDEKEDDDEGVKIKVEGCGIPEINGTYKQCDMHNRKPMFSKKGRWDERDGEFIINSQVTLAGCAYWWSTFYDVDDNREFWQRHCHSEMHFFVSFLSEIVHRCTDEDIDFYKVRIIGPDDADLPPKDGWVALDQGVNPPPHITFLGNDSE